MSERPSTEELKAICREHGWDGDRAHIALAFEFGRVGNIHGAIQALRALDEGDQ